MGCDISMRVTIRQATVEDAAIISFIGVTSWQAAYRGIVPDSYLDSLSVEQRKKHLAKNLSVSDNHFAIAQIDDQDAGMICFYPSQNEKVTESTWEVEALYILPQYWNKGIGHTLMRYAFECMKDQKITFCELWVLAENTRARKFYKCLGFTYTGIEKNISIGSRDLIEVCYRICL